MFNSIIQSQDMKRERKKKANQLRTSSRKRNSMSQPDEDTNPHDKSGCKYTVTTSCC